MVPGALVVLISIGVSVRVKMHASQQSPTMRL